jgi:hypothetical protein
MRPAQMASDPVCRSHDSKVAVVWGWAIKAFLCFSTAEKENIIEPVVNRPMHANIHIEREGLLVEHENNDRSRQVMDKP